MKIRDQLLSVEMRIFNNIKKEVEDETGGIWKGTRDQNKLADLKVAQSIHSSFKKYEEGRHYHGSYFSFRRT